MKMTLLSVVVALSSTQVLAESYSGQRVLQKCVAQRAGDDDSKYACTTENLPALPKTCTLSFGEGRYKGLVHLREDLSGTLASSDFGRRGIDAQNNGYSEYAILGMTRTREGHVGRDTTAFIHFGLDQGGHLGAPQFFQVTEQMPFLGRAVFYVSRCEDLKKDD